MIRGVGVDMASIPALRQIAERVGEGGLEKMFTPGERAAAAQSPEPFAYLAARFAAKEAVFKALGPLLPERSFDYRRVETGSREDGSPYVRIDGFMAELLRRADVSRLHISLTTEGELAMAFVVAENGGKAAHE